MGRQLSDVKIKVYALPCSLFVRFRVSRDIALPPVYAGVDTVIPNRVQRPVAVR